MMTEKHFLTTKLWSEFEVHLQVEAKYSQNPAAKGADKSRFMQIARFFEENKLEWTRKNWNDFVKYRQDSGNSNGYLNKFHSLGIQLDKFFRTKELEGFTFFEEEIPIDIVVLTYEEIGAIASVTIPYRKMAGFLNQQYRALFTMWRISAMRPQEICNLTWDDLKFSGKAWYLLVKKTKNYLARKIPIGNEAASLISELPHRSQFIFNSYRGKQLQPHDLTMEVKRRAQAVGITKNVFSYTLRHSGGTNAFLSGMRDLNVKKLMGHKSFSTTERYIHADINDLYLDMTAMEPLANDRTKEVEEKMVYEFLSKFFPNRSDIEISASGEFKITIKGKKY